MRAGNVWLRMMGYAALASGIAVAAVVLAAAALGLFGPEDRCLDAGGVWHAGEERCEGARPDG